MILPGKAGIKRGGWRRLSSRVRAASVVETRDLVVATDGAAMECTGAARSERLCHGVRDERSGVSMTGKIGRGMSIRSSMTEQVHAHGTGRHRGKDKGAVLRLRVHIAMA